MKSTEEIKDHFKKLRANIRKLHERVDDLEVSMAIQSLVPDAFENGNPKVKFEKQSRRLPTLNKRKIFKSCTINGNVFPIKYIPEELLRIAK